MTVCASLPPRDLLCSAATSHAGPRPGAFPCGSLYPLLPVPGDCYVNIGTSCGPAASSHCAARAQGPSHHRARSSRSLAVLHARLSAGGGARLGRHHRGPRRQPLPRFQCRHRRRRHRPLPPARSAGYPAPSRASDSHVRHRLLLRKHGDSSREVSPIGARRLPGTPASLLWQLRRRGCRSSFETRALSHRARQVHSLPRSLSRPHDGRAIGHRQ